MSVFTAPNLNQLGLNSLPFPETVKTISYEDLLAELKQDLIDEFPDVTDVINLETDPLVYLLQRMASEIVKLHGQINDESRKNTLAHGFGSSLDNFGAFWGVVRIELEAADPDASPPKEAVMESDDDFKLRIQLAPEGLTVAGSPGSYVFHGLSSSPDVKGIEPKRGEPGETVIYVLSRLGNGMPSSELLETVHLYLDDRRPLCSNISVTAAAIYDYQVSGEITFLPSFDQGKVLAAANAALAAYTETQAQLGYDVTIAGLHHAGFQEGVQNFKLTAPLVDIVCDVSAATHCTEITLNEGGIDV